MIPELGQVALSLALAVALVQAIFPLVNPGLSALARSAAQAQALLVAFAFGCLPGRSSPTTSRCPTWR